MSSYEQLVRKSEDAGFTNWEKVIHIIPPRYPLYRSSAPWYDRVDAGHKEQDLPQKTLEFLVNTAQIKHVISLNTHADNPKVKTALNRVGIHYTPLQTPDWTAPTQDALLEGITEFRNHDHPVLVWCSAGCGRTGTMVTAIQMSFEADKKNKYERKKFGRDDYEQNEVEEWNESGDREAGELKTGQYEALDKLQAHLYGERK